jgi:hypothetical protein
MNRHLRGETEDLIAEHPARVNAWITTFGGKRIKLPSIHPSAVSLIDIGHSLGLQCRYMGQCRHFYSVAEHSVIVKELARLSGEDEEVQLACLLHDAHEAYLGDFPSPFKLAIEGLREFEDEVERSVREALGLPDKRDQVWKRVKHYDIIALHLEANTLLNKPGWIDDRILDLVPRFEHGGEMVRVHGWAPDIATEMFRRELHEAGIGLGGNA